MHKDKRNIILSLLISLLFMGGTFSFAYFLMDITGTGSDVSKVTTGTLNLSVSDSLKSEYLKYKLISNTNIYTGDFSNIENNKLLLADSSMVEAGINKKYTLYIWISYDENIVQNDMLGTTLNGNIYIESKDCRSVNYDFETLALYVDNEKVDKLDKTKNYSLESYTCANNETITYNNKERSILVKPIELETKCSLYFKRIYLPSEYIQSGARVIYDGEYNTEGGHKSDITSWYDWSGNSNNGEVVGATFGSNYLSFDGNDYVRVGHHDYNTFTIEAIVLADSLSTTVASSIASSYDSGGYGLMINAAGIFSMGVHVDGSYKGVNSLQKATTNTIYSVLGSYSGTYIYLYINNIFNNKVNQTGEVKVPGRDTIMILGANPGGNIAEAEYLTGKIYSFRLYNRALTEEERTHNYNIDKIRFGI